MVVLLSQDGCDSRRSMVKVIPEMRNSEQVGSVAQVTMFH